MTLPILIVDDSLTVRMDLLDAFEVAGLSVMLCETLETARVALSTQAFGAVLLDVLLPDGDGVDLLREIREDPSLAALPVLMLSTEAEIGDRIRGLRTGADDYVGKPYDRNYVVSRTGELLRTKEHLRDGTPTPLILVIDDSSTFRNEFRAELEAEGYRVILAATGEEGLRMVAGARPDAVVVDANLPGIDGVTVIRELKLDAALRRIPCLLLTAADEAYYELAALEAGADVFIRKGEDLAIILSRLVVMLRQVEPTAGGEMRSLFGPKRVLAVDDSMTFLQELAAQIRQEDYEVILAESGEQALELLAVQQVDCIMLDLIMPGLSGRDTCQRIKATPEWRDIPLIMLTAQEDRSTMIDAFNIGADDYIPKSSDFEVVRARLRAQIRRKYFEDENRRIREELLLNERKTAEARAAERLAQTRAALMAELEQRSDEVAQKNQELERATRLKSEFLANMSHELRTPLNAIIGFSEALKDGLVGMLAPEQQDFVGHIFSNGEHLLALINDILDLSKIEAGKMELELAPEDIEPLLHASLSIVTEKALLHGIRLWLDAEAGGSVVLDARKTKQILYNLLSNAVKFTPQGGEVCLRARRVDADAVKAAAFVTDGAPEPAAGDYLALSVADTGIGIAADDLPRLFRPFTQLDSGLGRRYEGTGLGLALVKQLAELHDGFVAVASEEGKGSTFSVWLPWRTAAVQDGT